MFFSNLLQSSLPDELFIPFQLHLFLKSFIYNVLCEFPPIFHDLMQQLQHVEKNCHHYKQDLLLIFYFLFNQENYTIHHDSDLFMVILMQ